MIFSYARRLSHASVASTSTRIDFLRILLILALVFLHYGSVVGSDISPFMGYVGQENPIAAIVISYVLFFAFAAVPLLSAISGFLFFRSAHSEVRPDFSRLWRKRLKSVVLPFVLWSGGYVAAAYLAHLIRPSLFAALFSSEAGATALTLLDAAFALTDTPFAIQFWFLRDLIVTMALAPLIWLAVTRIPLLWTGFLTLSWLTEQTFGLFIRLDIFMFFNIGAMIAIYRLDLTRLDRWALPLFAGFLLVVALRTVAPVLIGAESERTLELMSSLLRLVGVMALWSLAGRLALTGLGEMLRRYSGMAFFIFCAHYPLIMYVKKMLASVAPPSGEAGLLLNYVASIGLTLALIGLAAILLNRLIPRVYAILNGGRETPEKGGVAVQG